ncbi:MAG: hypothetical protein AAF870_06855 [Pseudomonadota bacterium]
MADSFSMPLERHFGWNLKPTNSTEFEIIEKPTGQFCVVLNHALLRGVTSEMIFWWFQSFPNLKVKLKDISGYEGQVVPGYLLWHPSDHCSADLSGRLGPNNTSQAGAKIHIREAMQFNTYGLKYPVNTQLEIFYCAPDGWAMGRSVPFFGKAMCLRIHYKDVIENGEIVGVHYHYEVVIGVNGTSPIAKRINRKITQSYAPEFFDAWHLHNTIEVGVFENFLPALFAQYKSGSALKYETSMDPMASMNGVQAAQDPELFRARVEGYKATHDPFGYQKPEHASFL